MKTKNFVATLKELTMIIEKTSRGLLTAAMMIFFIIAAAIPAVFAQSGDMPLTASKEALALFKQGLEKAENLEDPGTLFDQAVQKDPNFAFGYLFAGQNNLEFRQNLEKAVSLADKASPGEREWILAAQDQNNGNQAGQLAHLEKLLKLHPRDKRAHTQIGQYYRNIGDEPTALRHYSEAIKIDKKYAPAYNNIGYSNMALGKYADAEAAFKNYIKLIPNNPNPYDSYAELLMKIGKYDESIKQYNMALAKDPTFIASYRGIGNDYAYKGDYAKSRATYQMMYDKATNDFNRDQALSSTMNAWIAEGNIEKAMEVNDRRIAIAEKTGDVQTMLNLHNLAGFINIEAGNLDAAAEHFEMAAKLASNPSLAAAQAGNRKFNSALQRSRYLAARGQFDEARSELDAARGALATRNVNQERNLNQAAGYLELKQKNYAKANEFFAKANPNDPFVWYYRAVASEGAGDTKSAAELYRRIAGWNQLDTTGYALVRSRAMAKLQK
ncbi:MAG TPA: tetratricopeptide repeat protein [Pyrinomonadaceae bacterium]|nr:tetratricopeptide repeat protein [Pyrinomonadaceae bacterium]